MDVGVVAERAPPGVQRQQQARGGPQVPGVAQHLQQALAHAVEQQLGQSLAVELPQPEQFVRQGEHHMKVRAPQQSIQLGLHPRLARAARTARAAAVAASVEHLALGVTLGAIVQVSAALGGVARADAVGRTELARVQPTALRKRIKVLGENVLHRAPHSYPQTVAVVLWYSY